MIHGSYKLGLAPMEGVSELAFRLWIAQTSAPDFSSTPFLRATDSYPAELPVDFAPETAGDLSLEYQLIPQVMASRPEDFIRTAKLLLPQAAFVDLNCGCPSPNPVSGGAGSSLLRDPEHFLEFAQKVCDALPDFSFSIKMRTGFHDNGLFSQLIEGLGALPLKQLTVHGRTRVDRYDGKSRWDLIQWAAEKLPFPVIGSGDILGWNSFQSAGQEAPDVNRLIIGRGVLRNPWIFTELRTGQEVELNRPLLQLTLACFALLTELGLDHQADRLLPLVREGLWRSKAGNSLSAWQHLYDKLCEALTGQPRVFAELELSRITLGRVKMIWSSLRSSLPEAYFAPWLLRSKSISELLLGLEIIDPSSDKFKIGHRPELDWLYTSSRKKPVRSDEEALGPQDPSQITV